MDFYKELLEINNEYFLKELKHNQSNFKEYCKENNYVFKISPNNSIKYNFPLYESMINKYLLKCVDNHTNLSKYNCG